MADVDSKVAMIMLWGGLPVTVTVSSYSCEWWDGLSYRSSENYCTMEWSMRSAYTQLECVI